MGHANELRAIAELLLQRVHVIPARQARVALAAVPYALSDI